MPVEPEDKECIPDVTGLIIERARDIMEYFRRIRNMESNDPMVGELLDPFFGQKMSLLHDVSSDERCVNPDIPSLCFSFCYLIFAYIP